MQYKIVLALKEKQHFNDENSDLLLYRKRISSLIEAMKMNLPQGNSLKHSNI